MKIQIEDLTKRYKNKEVLKNIHCLLDSEKYGIIGPNGSGKTTLIRCLLQMIQYRGSILFNGHEYNNDIHIGYLPQTFNAFKDLTVYEQLEYFIVLKKIDRDIDEEIDRVLKIVRLTEEKNKKIKSLSGGMVRRLGIAQALIGEPDLLVFDEPTVGLDPDERLYFREMIRTLELDIPIILTTHIIEDVSSICDNLIFLKQGELKYIGNIQNLLNQFSNRVYECPIDHLKDIQENIIKTEINQNQVRIISYQSLDYPFLTLVCPTIEDIYQAINQGYEKLS